MMRETAVGTVGYESRTTTSGRRPQLWVFLVLTIVHFIAMMLGFRVWYYLRQPGKDPALELEQCGAIGLVIAAVAYGFYFRRSWRLTLAAVAVAFVMGAVTGLSAVALHLYRYGWY